MRCQHQQGKECFTGWSEDTEAFFMGVRVLVVSNNIFYELQDYENKMIWEYKNAKVTIQ